MLLGTDKIISVAGTRSLCEYDKFPIILISINKYERLFRERDLNGTF